jgi:nuclear GTP-binding protein
MSKRGITFNRVNKRDIATNPERKVAKGDTNKRGKKITHDREFFFFFLFFSSLDNATTKRIKMYSAKPHRDHKGKLISGQFMSKETNPGAGRVMADRRWFGNTRVIGQNELETFREELSVAREDPYQLVLAQQKLPMSLLDNGQKEKAEKKAHIVDVEPWEQTFGKKATRKRPRLGVTELESLAKQAEEQGEKFAEEIEEGKHLVKEVVKRESGVPSFLKGQSKRIWAELYKVLDSSDVVIQVLDARNPMGTRSKTVEKHVLEKCKGKHLIFVLNKCDLVPTWATARWIAILSKIAPTLAFHAHLTRPFGKGNLINLLRQLAQLHPEKKQISVGFVGYPNVGKSSLINALKGKKVCNTAPTPGETKVWQYVTLFKRVYLIDCPGTVPATGDSPHDIVLKGVTRVQNLPDPESHVEELLTRARHDHVRAAYGVKQWTDCTDFLEQLARRAGRLLKVN